MASQAKLINNICGKISKSNLVHVGLGESTNMFMEKQECADEKSTEIVMRTVCGEVKAADISGKCRGMFRVSRGYDNRPVLYTVYDNSLYLVNEDNTTEWIATIPSNNTECRMTETGGYGSSHPHLIIVDGYNVYAVNTGLPVGDQQADFKAIDLPVRVKKDPSEPDVAIKPSHCSYLYGYLIVNDAGTDGFYISYQYPFEISDSEPDSFYQDREEFVNWWMTLTDEQKTEYQAGHIHDVYWDQWQAFITGTADDTPEVNDLFRVNTVQFAKYGFVTYSEWSPDNTIALISNGSKLYTFGERSWQYFSYNDDYNNPFSSPDNAAGNIGIKAPNSLAMLGQTALWLGNSDIGDNGVFMIQDTTLKRISTQDIEREIQQIAHPEHAIAGIWMEHKHCFYSLTFIEEQKTFVYDVNEDAWHYRASYDDKNMLVAWRYVYPTYAYGKIYVGTKDALCYMDANVYTEHDGKPIYKMRRGGMLTYNNQPFYIDMIRLITNNGQHSYNDQYTNLELNPRVSFRYSWDGADWSDFEDCYMGKLGRYDYETVLYGCGLGRYFTLEISTTENIPFSIQNLEIKYAPTSIF